ncbi:hypothetical protein B0J15DRAFT_468175 [Fusarium solani]|uniref:Uncharacterized protein n=1 Tax=Fusarium solani TaxID=169388 RepID=A0A9P9H1G3_FUSSL|nr:uncharacterized protein B0J15DRAFT_468175 [Fusarium solani]KAH7248137.1 hypothetical protein B0J15DRAFT_468175 [Fusarium solani]
MVIYGASPETVYLNNGFFHSLSSPPPFGSCAKMEYGLKARAYDAMVTCKETYKPVIHLACVVPCHLSRARTTTIVNSFTVSVNATPQLASGNSLLPMRSAD